MRNQAEDNIARNVVSKISVYGAKAVLAPVAATTTATLLGGGTIASLAVVAAPFAVAGAVGWAVSEAWDSLSDWF